MDTATARIPVRSRRQAMDWSLVLASQDIGVIIDYAKDGTGWGLVVAQADLDRGLNALRQYKLENPLPIWRQEVLQSGLLFDWVSFAWVLLVFFFFQLDLELPLKPAGEMNSALVAQGQRWRLFTAVWLHADIGHLAANATLGFALLGLVMGRYGTGIGLLAAYLSGAGGNVFAGLLARFLSDHPHQSLGASGMVMGCVGLLAVPSISLWRRTPHATRSMIAGIGSGALLFLLLGLAPGSDIAAHFGGFLSGLLLGAALAASAALGRKALPGRLCTLGFMVLVIVPWWMALRFHY